MNLGMKYIKHIIYLSSILLFSSCNVETNNPNDVGNEIIDKQSTWSPNRYTIGYIGGTTEKTFGMYSVDTTVSNKNEISVPDLISFPDWSPDGQWLVYSKYGNIFKRNIADNIEIQLTFFGGNRFPSWSNDGVWIAFHSNKDSPNGMSFIWKMKSDGSELKRIIYTPEDGEVKHPDWFPDGIRLVVIRSLLSHRSPEVCIIDTSGNTISVLTNDFSYDRYPKVSSRYEIVYERDDNLGEICFIKEDGSNHKLLIPNAINPNWSPDGIKISYTNKNDGRIWIMSKDGTNKKRVSY